MLGIRRQSEMPPIQLQFRYIWLVLNLGVLHQVSNNELICEIHNAYTFGLLLLQFIYLVFMPNDVYHIVHLCIAYLNVLFGAHLLMAIKPNDWFLSYKLDCGTLYNSSNTISRMAYLGYGSIVFSSKYISDILDDYCKGTNILCIQKQKNVWKFLCLHLSNEKMYYALVCIIGLFTFGICALLVLVFGK